MTAPPCKDRSRIRRRSGVGCCVGPAACRTAGSLLLALAALPRLPSARAYLGPTHCVKPGTTAAAAVVQSASTVGYATFNHLLFDMVSIAASFKGGQIVPDDRLLFKLCPGTVIDLDDSSLPLGFLPIEVPRLTLQCGDSGRRGSDPNGSDSCVIRGGGRRSTNYREWNTNPAQAYKPSDDGIVGGGDGSVAQVYVYGESAYEVTLRGLTFDNSVTEEEMRLYGEYASEFGGGAASNGFNNGGGAGGAAGSGGATAEKSEIQQEYEASVPPDQSSGGSNWAGADQLAQKDNAQQRQRRRNLQGQSGPGPKPAHRFASVAVRGKGYGDDAGPRLITIEDCRFIGHSGYAVLVSPGIQQPDLPLAPEFDLPASPSSSAGGAPGGGVPEKNSGADNIMAQALNVQSSGQIYAAGHNNTVRNEGANNAVGGGGGNRGRLLNLLDEGGKFIPRDGLVSYYDHSSGKSYRDGRRVKITKTEFADNVVEGDKVAGLITSAYSLTLTDCFFRRNQAKAVVFVYNNEALVDNTIFAENTVEVSTVIMASPKGSKLLATKGNEPTHIVERTCFLGSNVGMSNVLVTDVENTGFGQRDNHAKGTKFTWVSKCEGGAAERLGNDCLETGNCDGTCVEFTSERCAADGADSREFEMFFNAAYRGSGGGGARWWWATSFGILAWLFS